MARNELDFYETPPALVKALLDHVEIKGTVFEPCAGDMAIARFFPGCLTNDIDMDRETNMYLDISQWESWQYLNRPHDWVVTNPPFNLAEKILPQAFKWANKGVAFLLRLSYLEPTLDRGLWLHQHREFLSHVIVFNPRPRFRRNKKGQLATDSVTVAWFVWEKPHNVYIGTEIHFVRGWMKWEI